MHTNFLIEVLDERQREKLFSALLLVNDHNFVEQIIEHSGGVRMRESTIGVVTAALVCLNPPHSLPKNAH
jgi:acetyl-CoA carboxylase beta subunit